MTTGSFEPDNIKTEVLEGESWVTSIDYPFHPRLELFPMFQIGIRNQYFELYFSIFGYSTASTDTAAYFIGGYYEGRVSTIAKYDDFGWSKIGDLSVRRSSHASIISGTQVIIFGGYCEAEQ